MKAHISIVLVLAGIGCGESTPVPENTGPDTIAVQRVNQEMSRVIAASSAILEPLRTLNQEQQVAAVSLALLVQGVAAYQVSQLAPDNSLVADFRRVLVDVSPTFGRMRDPVSLMMACMDESVAYASALASCEADDPPRDEDECTEAWGPGASETRCMMGAIQNLQMIINDLFGQLDPPGPLPFPER